MDFLTKNAIFWKLELKLLPERLISKSAAKNILDILMYMVLNIFESNLLKCCIISECSYNFVSTSFCCMLNLFS